MYGFALGCASTYIITLTPESCDRVGERAGGYKNAVAVHARVCVGVCVRVYVAG